MDQDSAIEDIQLKISADGPALRITIEAPMGTGNAPFELPDPLIASLQEFRWPQSAQSLGASRLLKRRDKVGEEPSAAATAIGEGLFKALFPKDLRRLLDGSRGSIRRLRLGWDPHEPRLTRLQNLPWELLKDPANGIFLVFDPTYSFLRQLPIEVREPPPPAPASRWMILGFGPSPTDSDFLQVKEEWATLRRLQDEGSGLVFVCPGKKDILDPQTLRRYLEVKGAHILHFMGHGTVDSADRGQLCFENEIRKTKMFSGEDLAQTLRGLPNLRLVFLNACHSAFTHVRPFSGVATALIRGGTPAVLAMQSSITDKAARIFSGQLYRQLAAGQSLDRAVCEARRAVHSENPQGLEWALPALFVQPGSESLEAEERLANPAGSTSAAELLRRYLSDIVAATRFVELTWLASAGPKPRLELTALFALFHPDPKPLFERLRRAEDIAKERERLERTFEYQALDPEREEIHLWQALRRLAKGEQDAGGQPADHEADLFSFDHLTRLFSPLVILGENGSGKTHLLRWLAHQHAAARSAGRKRVRVMARQVDGRRDAEELLDLGPSRIPILFQLQKMIGKPCQYPGELLDAAEIPAPKASYEQLRRLLEREIIAGRALLLFDGLDRVAEPAERQRIVQEIEACITQHLPRSEAQVVLVSRAAGYDQAAFGPAFAHFRLESMGPATMAAFSRIFAPALGRRGEELAAAARELLGRGEPHWAATPLMLTFLAAVLACGGGHLPTRRVDLYEPAVGLLLARWQQLHDSQEEPKPPGDRAWLELLAALAAELQSQPSRCGLIEKSRLIVWLGQRLEVFSPSVVERWLSRDLGPLSSFGGSLLGFLHRAMQSYLAACWLVSASDLAEDRIRQHLNDPLWRESTAMALGLLAEVLGQEEFGRLARRLGLGPGAEPAGPYPDLLGLALLPELPEGHEAWQEAFLADLLLRSAGAGDEAWRNLVERTLVRIDGRSRVAVRVLALGLEKSQDQGDRGLAAMVARIALALPEIPGELADLLQGVESLDQEPWPIEQCLRRLAEHDPTSLLTPALSPRRLLRREPTLAGFVVKHPGWRRLLLAVYGLRPGTLLPYRGSALDAGITRALQNFREPEDLCLDLQILAADPAHPGNGDAAVALFVLRQPLPGGQDGWRNELGRLKTRLGPVMAPEDLLLRLFEGSAAAADRAGLLGLFWRRLMNSDSDTRFRLAVLLDTRGGELAASLPVLAASFVAATTGQAAKVDSLAAEDLLACLGALLSMPSALDFIAGWAIAVLRPLFESHRLGTAAALAGEVLSERFSARSDTRQRLTQRFIPPKSQEDLLKMADSLEASLFRERLCQRLAGADVCRGPSGNEDALLEVLWRSALALDLGQDEDPALLSLMLGEHPEANDLPQVSAARPRLDLERVEWLIANLAADADRERLEATFELSGENRPWRQNRSARSIGIEPLLCLARHWLDLQLHDPRRALVVRWCLQSVEHDAPELLLQLAELAGGQGPEAEPAEVLLLHLEELDREMAWVLAEVLRSGPPRSRRALVRALPNGLSLGGRPASTIWKMVGAELPRQAELFAEERLPAESPLALIEAAEAARAELPEGEPAAVLARARGIYSRQGKTWSSLLLSDPATLQQVLVQIGERRRINTAARALAPAVDKLCRQPELIPLLVGWAENCLAEEGQRRSLDDREASDLLGILAVTASRLPATLHAVVAERPSWRRRLGRAAVDFDWLSARRDAILLLGMGRILGRYELEALLAAMQDVPQVQDEAIASIARYRRLESLAVLERLAQEFHSISPARAYAAGRVLATLGRPGTGDPALWRRCREILCEVVPDPQRLVYLPTWDGSMTGIRCLGRLGQLLRSLQLQLEGIPCELFGH